MAIQEIQKSIKGLRSKLANRLERYDKALLKNARFNERKGIRTEIRKLQQDIIALKNSNRFVSETQ